MPIIPINETYETYETYSRPLRYRVVSSKDEEVWNTGERGFLPISITYISEVILENQDEHGGTFIVTHIWEEESLGALPKKEKMQYTTKQYLAPGEVGDFSENFTIGTKSRYSIDFLNYKISAPKVQDERLVTRHKTHFKSIIEILLDLVNR